MSEDNWIDKGLHNTRAKENQAYDRHFKHIWINMNLRKFTEFLLHKAASLATSLFYSELESLRGVVAYIFDSENFNFTVLRSFNQKTEPTIRKGWLMFNTKARQLKASLRCKRWKKN